MAHVPLIGIIDDSEQYRNALDPFLQGAGFRTMHFESADAFLESNRKVEPDCLILDHRMPGTTGLQLAHKLVEINHPAPFIMVSFAPEDIRKAALKAGATAVFAKSESPSVLIDAVRVALKSKRAVVTR